MAFDNVIAALRNGSAESSVNVEVANNFDLLKDQVSDLLSLTSQEASKVQSDTRRYKVETSTKSDELRKLKKTLLVAREERKERRDELEAELGELKRVLAEKVEVLRREQDEIIAQNAAEEQIEKQLFDAEIVALDKLRDDLRKQLEEQKLDHAELESRLEDAISSLTFELEQTASNRKEVLSANMEEMRTTKDKLKQQKERRDVLEEHFERVDANNAVKQKEEEALQRVADIMRKAQELLDTGAAQLQRLYRGMRDRALVQKMKKSKKKGKKGKGKKK